VVSYALSVARPRLVHQVAHTAMREEADLQSCLLYLCLYRKFHAWSRILLTSERRSIGECATARE
jgi:hypothetical protein